MAGCSWPGCAKFFPSLHLRFNPPIRVIACPLQWAMTEITLTITGDSSTPSGMTKSPRIGDRETSQTARQRLGHDAGVGHCVATASCSVQFAQWEQRYLSRPHIHHQNRNEVSVQSPGSRTLFQTISMLITHKTKTLVKKLSCAIFILIQEKQTLSVLSPD